MWRPTRAIWKLHSLPVWHRPLIRTVSTVTNPLQSGPYILADAVTPRLVKGAYSLLQAAVERKENIGRNEFPTERHLEEILLRSKVLCLASDHKDQLECVATIGPCRIARGVCPNLSEFHFLLWRPTRAIWKLHSLPVWHRPLIRTVSTVTNPLQSGPYILADAVTPRLVKGAYSLLQAAVERKENIGRNEFPTERHLEEILLRSKVLCLASDHKDQLECVATIGPCRIARGVCPNLSEFHFLLSRDLSAQSSAILPELLGRCERIAEEAGYSACMMQVAVNCIDWIKELRAFGYLPTACLPKTVDIEGEGLVDSLVLYKRLHAPNAQAVGSEEICNSPEVLSNTMTPEEFDACVLPSVSGLPLEFKVSGRDLIVRGMRREESEVVYGWYVTASANGMGYSLDEFPTLGFFRKKFLSRGAVTVFEDNALGEIARVAITLPSPYSRCLNGRVCRNMFAGNPEYREPLDMYSVLRLVEGVEVSLGYRELLSSCLLNQYRILKYNMEFGGLHIGVLPDAMNTVDQGWIDVVVVYEEFAQPRTITQLAADSPS